MRIDFKPLLIGIAGLIFLFLGLGMIIGSQEVIPKTYYHFNPPVYNPPVNTTNINSEKLLTLINQRRQNKGLKTFQESRMLSYVAYLRAKTIFDTQEFTHESTRSGLTYSNIADKLGYFYESLGENLAIGYANEEEIVTEWEKSKEHADNMFSNVYIEAGIYTLKGIFYEDSVNATVLILGK